MDSWIIAQNAQIYAVIAEVEGMKAMNKQREHCGESMAYNDDHFFAKANELRSLSDYIMQHR
jgi:hypothetical protein